MRHLKKYICIFLTFGFVFGLISCGQAEEEGDMEDFSSLSDAKTKSMEAVFSEDDDFSISEVKGWVSSLVLSDNNLFFYTEESGDKNIIRFYKVSKEGGTPELIAELETDDKTYMDELFLDKDENIYVTQTKWTSDERNKTSLYTLKNGKLDNEKNISKITDVSGDSWLSELYMDKSGNLVAVYDDEIKIYNQELKVVSDSEPGGYIETAGLSRDGDVVIVQMNTVDNKNVMTVKVMDPVKGNLSDEYVIDARYINRIITGSGDYDFFYQTSSGIYGYNLSDKKEEEIFNFVNSDLDYEDISDEVVDSPDSIYAILSDEEDDRIVRYKKEDIKEEGRIVLTVLSQCSNNDLKERIIDYNKSQTKYRVKIIDYSNEKNAGDKIQASLDAGDHPDIYDFSDEIGHMSVNQCISKGLFEDITGYIEKDPDIRTEDIIPSVYNAMKSNGKLYFVSSGFTLQTLLAKASDVGKEYGWTYDEFKSFTQSKDEGALMFRSESKSDKLREILDGTIEDFIDWDKKETYFDSQDFKDILESCNSDLEEKVSDEEAVSEPDMIRSGKILFVNGDMTPDQIQIYNKLFKGDVSFKGYPSKEGTGTKISFGRRLAISSDCENKDGAWDFIRQFMTEEYQGNNLQTLWGVPTRQDVYEVFVDNLKSSEKKTDIYGNVYEPNNSEYSWEDFTMKLHPVTDEELDEFSSLLDSSDGRFEREARIINIVADEADTYFSGDNSLDEAVLNIQSELRALLDE